MNLFCLAMLSTCVEWALAGGEDGDDDEDTDFGNSEGGELIQRRTPSSTPLDFIQRRQTASNSPWCIFAPLKLLHQQQQ